MGIVVSVLAPDLGSLARAAREAAPSAELIELRLDALRGVRAPELAQLLRELEKPVIAAVHGPEGFGSFAGDVRERCALLRAAAEAGAAFVDVDARFAAELGALPAGTRRIVSHHDLERTPADVEALFAAVDARAQAGDLVKVVTHASCAEDGLRLLAALRRSTRERVAFCSGEAGSFTRVLAPACGSRLTYAAPSAASATAPGQLDVQALLRAWPRGSGGLGTRFFAVLGRPVAHSWSPRLHTATFAALGIDALYVACEPREIGAFLALAREVPFDGFSVTAPFKSGARALAGESDALVDASGAANTLVRAGARWQAHNTDASAVLAVIEEALPRPLARARVVVLGGGGAARAAACALSRAGAQVCVAVRDLERAAWVRTTPGCELVPLASVEQTAHDVLINCTPVGSRSDPGRSPLPEAWIRPGSVVLDAAYRPRATPLLEAARARGAVAVSGARWFLHQACAQAGLFTRSDERARLLQVLEAELERAYAEDEP